MNKLLPLKEELKFIKDKNNTFYECGFNKNFDELEFIDKLKIVNDIVRQTILPKTINNPYIDDNNLIGNCHTSCLESIKYLKYLNLGKNYRYVLARRKKYEPEDITTKHAVILIDDDEGHTYEYDATPFVGYGYGTVKKLTSNSLYSEYVTVNNDIFFYLFEMRKLLYSISLGKFDFTKKQYYLDILENAKKYQILNGFISYCYKQLLLLYPLEYYYLNESIRLNPYIDLNEEKKYYDKKKSLAFKQIKLWKEELEELKSNDKDLKRQLILAQNIIQELKLYDSSYENYFTYKGTKIPLSHLSPRFFYEEGLNTIAIKASAFRLGVRGTIREYILKNSSGAIEEYFSNAVSKTKYTGLCPMLFSHPLGKQYERSMNGPINIFLIKEQSENIKVKKLLLREILGKNLYLRDVNWFDGEPIYWHPFVTNLVHSTDNPSEACLHYLMVNPEHQLMTRFMYPNPKLMVLK